MKVDVRFLNADLWQDFMFFCKMSNENRVSCSVNDATFDIVV
jgi:hypothetical protein